MDKEKLKNIKILYGKDVTVDFIMQAVDLDWKTYNDEYHITEEQGKDYLEKNPYIYFVAVIGDKLIGYINFSPITEKMYEMIKTGNYIDANIEKEDILIYEDNKIYSNYFSSVVVDKEYHDRGVANKLIDAVKNFIVLFEKERGIIIKRIIADVISEGGMKIVSKLGLKTIKKSNHCSNIAEWKKEEIEDGIIKN